MKGEVFSPIEFEKKTLTEETTEAIQSLVDVVDKCSSNPNVLDNLEQQLTQLLKQVVDARQTPSTIMTADTTSVKQEKTHVEDAQATLDEHVRVSSAGSTEADKTLEAKNDPDIQEYIDKDAQMLLDVADTQKILEQIKSYYKDQDTKVAIQALEGSVDFEWLLNWVSDSDERKDQFRLMFINDGRVFETTGDLEQIGLSRSEFCSQLEKYGYKIKDKGEHTNPFWVQARLAKDENGQPLLKRRAITSPRGLKI